jgi:hypothetical protein
MLTRPELDVTITGLPLLALRLATTVVLADLSYRFVETPVRNGAFGRAWKSLREARGAQRWRLRAGWAGAVGTSTAFLAVLVVALIHAQPPAPPSYLSVESIHTTGSTPTPGTEDPDTTPGIETPKTDISATATPEAGAVSSSTAPEPAAKVEKAPVSAPAERVTAIGDSVMIGAAGELQKSIGNPAMYADVGMQAAGVIEILQKRRAAGDLGEVVVVHIGSNGTLNAEQFDEMMQVLKDVRRVAFVNVKVPRPWEQPNNEVLADGVRRHPNTVLVDWHAASAGRPELFVEDGIHLQVEGQRVYADLIAAHLNAP